MSANRNVFTGGAVLVLLVLLSSVIALADPVKLNFMWPGGSVDKAIMQVLDKYADETGVEIETVSNASWSNHYEKLMIMAATDVPVDLVYVDEGHFQATAQGAFLDLTPLIARDGMDLTAFHQATLDAMTLHDKRTAIPGLVFSLALAYNKDLFDDNGLRYPSSDWESDDWLWSDFVQTAKKLTRDKNGNGNVDQFGVGGFPWWQRPWFWGSDWINESVTKSLVNSPATIEAMEKMAQLTLEYGVEMSPAVPHDLGSSASTEFRNGNVGMMYMGNWSLPSWSDQIEFNWDLGVFPKGLERKTVVYTDGFAIGRTTRHQEEAWKFVHTLTTDPEYVLAINLARAGLPAIKSLGDAWIQKMKSTYPNLSLEVLVNGLNHGRRQRLYNNGNFYRISDVINPAVQEILTGKKSAKQALEGIHNQVQQLLDEGQL